RPWNDRESRRAVRLCRQNDIILLQRNGEGFDLVGPFRDLAAGGDGDRIAPGLDAPRLAGRQAGAQVELPAMPGAAQDLAGAREAVAAGLPRLDEAGELALA